MAAQLAVLNLEVPAVVWVDLDDEPLVVDIDDEPILIEVRPLVQF